MAGDLRHIKLWKQLEEKAKEAAKTRQLAEETLAVADRLIKDAKNLDANVTDVTVLLTEASSAFSDKDYKSAYEKASECKERTLRVFRDRLRSMLDSNKILMDLVKSVGGDATAEENVMKQAEEALQKDEFGKAVDLATDSWKRMEKDLHEQISRMFSTAQSLILTAKNTGKDVTMAEGILSRAREAMDSNDYELAINSTKECLENIGSALKEEVLTHLDEIKALMDLAQQMGYDIKRLENSLRRIESEMDKYSYNTALHYSKQAKLDAEKNLQRAITEKMTALRSSLKGVSGPDGNVSSLEGTLEDAKNALKEGNHQLSVNYLKEVEDSIGTAKFEVVVDTISGFRPKFINATNIGIDISMAMDILNTSRERLQEGRYEEALQLAKKSEAEVDRLLEEHSEFQAELDGIQKDLDIGVELGIDVDSVRNTFESAKTELEGRNVKKSRELVQQCRITLDRLLSEGFNSAFERTRSHANLGQRMGLDLSDVTELLQASMNLADAKEFGKALEPYSKARTRTEDGIRDHLSKSLIGMRELIIAYLPKAEDSAPYNEMLRNAQDLLDTGEYEKALQVSEEGTELLGAKLFSELKNVINNVENILVVADQLELDTTQCKEKLSMGKRALEEKKYKDIMGINFEITNWLGERTNEVFNTLKQNLIKTKEMNIDIKSFMIILKEAATRKKEGDLLGAYQRLLECHTRIKDLFEAKTKAHELISSTTVLVAEAKKKDIDVTNILSKVLEAKKLLDANAYEKSYSMAMEARTVTKKLLDLHDASSRILDVKKKIDVAKELNIEVGIFADNLGKAAEALKNKDYDLALKYSSDADAEISNALRSELLPSLSTLQSLISEAKEIGINVTVAEQQFASAAEHLEGGLFREAAEAALNARNEIKRLKDLSKKAATTIKMAQDMANETESMNIPVVKFKNMIREALKMLDTHDYENAIQSADAAVAEMDRERSALISKTVGKVRDDLKKAKDEGMATESSEKFLERATEAFEQSRFKEAFEAITQAENEIERMMLQQDMALKSLNTARRKLESIKYPAPKVEEQLRKGEEAFKKGDYTKALEFAILSGDEFYKVMGLHDEAMLKLSEASKQLNISYKLGFKIPAASEMLRKANNSLSAGNFHEAHDFSDKSIRETRKGTVENFNALLKKFEELVGFANSIGVKPPDYAPKITEIRRQIGTGNFENALAILNDNKRGLEKMVADGLQHSIRDTRERIMQAKKMGADTSDSEMLFDNAMANLSQNNFTKVDEIIPEIEKSLVGKKNGELTYDERAKQAESIIAQCKKFGINVKEAESLLTESRSARAADVEKAIELVDGSLAIARKEMEPFSPKLETAMTIKPAVAGGWADGEIVVSNKGRVLAKDVTVAVTGDVETEEIKPIPVLKANGTVTIPLRLKFSYGGSVPLIVSVSAARFVDGEVFTEEKETVFEVQGPPPSNGEVKRVKKQRVL